MSTKKLFISCPMRGKSDAEIEQARQWAVDAAKHEYPNDTIIVLDSFFKGCSGDNPMRCLGKAIEVLADADIAYFCPGWEDARGCVFEHEVAMKYDTELVIDYYGHKL